VVQEIKTLGQNILPTLSYEAGFVGIKKEGVMIKRIKPL